MIKEVQRWSFKLSKKRMKKIKKRLRKIALSFFLVREALANSAELIESIEAILSIFG